MFHRLSPSQVLLLLLLPTYLLSYFLLNKFTDIYQSYVHTTKGVA